MSSTANSERTRRPLANTTFPDSGSTGPEPRRVSTIISGESTPSTRTATPRTASSTRGIRPLTTLRSPLRQTYMRRKRNQSAAPQFLRPGERNKLCAKFRASFEYCTDGLLFATLDGSPHLGPRFTALRPSRCAIFWQTWELFRLLRGTDDQGLSHELVEQSRGLPRVLERV